MKNARYRAGIAALALAAIGLLVPAVASAATITPGSAAAATSSASGSGTVTGTMPGSSVLCTSYWKWHVSDPLAGGYSEVEWTSNPCEFRIEDRSHCEYFTGPFTFSYSGIVKRTGLWDKADCGLTQQIIDAEQRFYNGSSWSAWKKYW